MNLSQKIAAALDARTDELAPLPSNVSVEQGPHRLSLHLTACGSVGVAFDTLDFKTSVRPDWPTDALKAWGDRIVTRLTYLMEPLLVLEVDRIGREVELRSQFPTARDGHRSYYEIRLDHNGALRLDRSSFDETTRLRRPASCQMTREALERLTDDLVACVA
ncbi:MAG TPA: hypothetical protein VGZ22_09145 [Isosphaeraceae bacterium]|jgi:hypothetical protein|nr:hypothetical protein [Isosphaeraceae bacterium]